MIKSRLLILVVCSVFSNIASAQLNNLALSDEWLFNENDTGRFQLHVNHLGYLRNTEYFNSFELGRTLFGQQLHPRIGYVAAKGILLQGGVFLRSDFGAIPNINQIQPTLTIKLLNEKAGRSFLFGTIEGALAHRLIEPLFDISQGIENRIENGAQFKINNKKMFFDTWINWQRYITKGSPYQEQFQAGLNLSPVVYESKSQLSITPVLQATAFHRGGQIDASDSSLVMIFNLAGGVAFKQIYTTSFVREVSLSGFFTKLEETSSNGLFSVKSGLGFYQNFFVKSKSLGLMLSYWESNNYNSVLGAPVLMSQSASFSNVFSKKRQLLFVRLLYEKSLSSNFQLVARVEPLYDFTTSLLDYSMSVYLCYRINRSF